jgi:hypothetical protein
MVDFTKFTDFDRSILSKISDFALSFMPMGGDTDHS